MEQKEKKQKSQAAENQASCPPQQPASPNPFISVIPLAVLIALIVLVVKLFPDDALAGASQVALMIATAVCVALGMGIYRMKWNIFEEMIKKTVGDAGSQKQGSSSMRTPIWRIWPDFWPRRPAKASASS